MVDTSLEMIKSVKRYLTEDIGGEKMSEEILKELCGHYKIKNYEIEKSNIT
ncbi:hypothetical protein [Caldicellulosiruptor changbaiensis]|uniref:hypothetical protein n=1 Tax=Caldicellulosiruptor changbaiensis TaxID=1222016 RepID=UPI0013DEF098|nr:hypothetical protein [Caldicellulosiruptor changbaiensis]